MNNNNQELVGLAKKIDQLLLEHGLQNLCVEELIIRPINDINEETNYVLEKCRYVRDPVTDEIIKVCD